jgi:hypothetical protein
MSESARLTPAAGADSGAVAARHFDQPQAGIQQLEEVH